MRVLTELCAAQAGKYCSCIYVGRASAQRPSINQSESKSAIVPALPLMGTRGKIKRTANSKSVYYVILRCGEHAQGW